MIKLIKEDASRGNVSWAIYKGDNLYFVDLNNSGLYGSVYTGGTKAEAMAKMDLGSHFAEYRYDSSLGEDDGGDEEYEAMKAWMEKRDKD